MLESYHRVFDDLRKNFLVGEMVWNFADFMTDYGSYLTFFSLYSNVLNAYI